MESTKLILSKRSYIHKASSHDKVAFLASLLIKQIDSSLCVLEDYI